MKLFEETRTPLLNAAIPALTAAVFVGDIFTPLGVSSWIFYLLPLVLSYMAWRPKAPLVMAAVTTVLLVAGYFFSPAGLSPVVGQLNRIFGAVTAWILGGVGHQFIVAKIAVRREEWLQAGRTSLADAIGGDLPLDKLGENVMGFLAPYLDAQAGVIFLEDGSGFRRFATYGVPAGAAVRDRFEPGDGLLGQVVRERRQMVIKDVPDDYVRVGSGLGECVPRYLLMAPLACDGEVNGAIELGFLHPVHESDGEFLRRVSEMIAVAVRSAVYRARLHELLGETQRQAEELQTQAEELRVSNEELEEQSRALRESQMRLEQQQAELEHTNTQLEEQMQLLEVQKEELENAKRESERQGAELAQASKYKSAFLANMSHELRTPLNSSLILSRLLSENREANLTEEQVEYARMIEAAGNDLLALINDVLDLAKVEAGHLDIRPQEFRLATLLDNLRATFAPLAREKGLTLQLDARDGAPETLFTDSQRIEQVLRNLLSNATKFTQHGTVKLEVSARDRDQIAFAVSDTGIGIAEDLQRSIFEPFRQADAATNRRYGGTGLGLSISREFVRLLKGEIRIASRVGEGSTFTVIIPARFSPDPGEPAAPALPEPVAAPMLPQPPATRRPSSAAAPVPQSDTSGRECAAASHRVVLVVEDDPSFARVLCDLAQELRFDCLMASTSAEAIRIAAQHSPAAVLLDVGLPDNSGLSVLDRIKADPRTRHIPVYVVSGKDHTATALSLGAVGCMLKPVRREQLIDAFQELERRLTQRLRRVLIVEDDPGQAVGLQRLLSSSEVEALCVATAAECLEKLKTTTFDCMVLDLSLPDASGFSVLETIAHEDRYSFPPVIVYTARDLTTAEEERLRKYSSSIIIKGAKSPERLLDEITLFLHQVIAELPAEKQKLLEQARSRDAALEGRHVLLVEDDVRNIFAVTSVLERHGVQLQTARNGREALEILDRATRGEAPRVDLVLMDLMMPEMDGLTATREIRNRAEWKKLPIIALTAKAMKNDQEESLAAGASDYMSKPLDVDKLLSLMRVWMPR